MSTTAGSGVEVVAIDTPALGDRSYLAHDGEVALVADPQRDIDRVLALAAAQEGADHPRLRDPSAQRLRDRRAGASARYRGGVPRQRGRRGGLRPGAGRGRGPRRGQPGHRGPGPRHPGTHLYPPVVCARGRRARARGVHRRVAALRLDGAAGPARAGPCRRTGAGPVRLGAPAGRRAARERGGVSHPRVRQLLLGHPVRGELLDDRPGTAGQPGADPGGGPVRERDARRTRRLPRLLRAHGPGQCRRAVRTRSVSHHTRRTPPS